MTSSHTEFELTRLEFSEL